MEEFDLNKVEREMPHKLPREDYFETFSAKLYTKIESEEIRPIEPAKTENKKRRRVLFSPYSIFSGVAAAVILVLMTVFTINHVRNNNNIDVFNAEGDIVESLDTYLTTLSDEEFSQLFEESSVQRDFYVNLPKFE
ncbi:MAG: hypothetical protein R3Y51_01225 [Rikenellaceae bacterium]